MKENVIKSLSDIASAIDEKELTSIVLKFKKVDKGVKINDTSLKYYKWDDLINPKLPLTILRTRVIELNKLINALEPGINSDVAFFHTEKEEIIPFTWSDTKEFVIEAIKYRMATPEYVALMNEKEQAIKEGDFKTVARISRKTGI